MIRIRQAITYVRLKPFDTSTAEGRAAERYRRAVWTTGVGVLARLLAIAASLISIPLAIGYLGTERYGLWVTISSLTAMLTFADLGLGNGLMNAIADANGRDDRGAAAGAVASAVVMLSVLAGIGTVIFVAIYGLVPWGGVFNVSSPTAIAEAGPTAAVFVLCVAANLPLGLVVRIQYGYQEGFTANAWAAVGSLIGLAGLVVAIQAHASLPWLVLAIAGGPVLATLLNGIVLFLRRHPELRPRPSLATRPVARRLMQLGFLFFVLQLAVAVAYQSDVVVAARMLGPDAAAEYAVTLRLFFLAPTFIGLILVPLWPAYGEAIARGDAGWVRATLVRSTVVSVGLSASASAVLLVFARDILRLWVGPVFEPPFMMLLGMALWAVVSSGFSSAAMLLNGASVIRFQVIVATVMAVVSILASIGLARLVGVTGIIWGTLLAYLACNAVPYILYLPRLLRVIEGRAELAGRGLDMTGPALEPAGQTGPNP
jgi:O-antigen/teichoic acid export membrane protein